MNVELKDSIYLKLLSNGERLKYRIINDNLIPGGMELLDPEWQENYIEEVFSDGKRYPFILVVIQINEIDCIARFISFGFDIYRIIWISMNHKRCMGALDEFYGSIAN